MKTTLVAGALAGLIAAPAVAQTINVAGNIGVTTQSKTLERPFWTEEVPEMTGATVNFQPWNEMGLKGPEVFRLLSNGVMNVATAQLGHHAGDAPINDATDLAGLSPTLAEFEAVTQAFTPVLSEFYREELGLEILTMQSYQAQILYCRDEITGLADLEGRKVRSSGASQADFVEHFGGTGVNMSFGEVQQGLAQGVIDCAITGALSGYSAKWYEGADFLYTLPINWGSGATVVNSEWWSGLDADLRQTLKTELDALEAEMWALNAAETEIGINCNTTGPCPLGEPGGMTRVDPSAEDVAARREAMVESVLPAFAERCGETCVEQFNATIGEVAGLTIE